MGLDKKWCKEKCKHYYEQESQDCREQQSKPWYKQWWIWLIAVIIISSISIIFIFVIPLVINYCYMEVDKFPTDWDGGVALQFYGTILTFISTTLLGVLALWQNHKLSKQNDEYRNMLVSKDIPAFAAKITSIADIASSPKINVKNLTNTIATEFEVLHCGIKVSKSEYIIEYNLEKISKNYFCGNDDIILEFSGGEMSLFDNHYPSLFEMVFRYKDVYGRLHDKVATKDFKNDKDYLGQMIIKEL